MLNISVSGVRVYEVVQNFNQQGELSSCRIAYVFTDSEGKDISLLGSRVVECRVSEEDCPGSSIDLTWATQKAQEHSTAEEAGEEEAGEDE